VRYSAPTCERRLAPEALGLHGALERPVRPQEHDVAALDVAGAPLEVGRADLPVVAEVRQVHDGRRAHPLVHGHLVVHRHLGDVAIAGKEMHGRVHMRVGVAARGEHGGLKDRARFMRRAALAADRPVEMRLEREGEVDGAHGRHGVPCAPALSTAR